MSESTLPKFLTRVALASAALAGIVSAGTYQCFTYTAEGPPFPGSPAGLQTAGTKLLVFVDNSGQQGVGFDFTTYNSGPPPPAGCWSIGLGSITLALNEWIEVRALGTVNGVEGIVATERFTGTGGGNVSILLDETPLAPAATTTISTSGCTRVSTTNSAGATLSSGLNIVPSVPRVITFAAASAGPGPTTISFVNAWSKGIPNWLSPASSDLDRVQVSSTSAQSATAYKKVQVFAKLNTGLAYFALTSLSAGNFGGACEPRLIVTKVVDGSLDPSGPNWVEITNVGTNAVDMTKYSIGHFPVGSTTMSTGAVQLHNLVNPPNAFLGAGKSFVFAYEPMNCAGPNCFQSVYNREPDQSFPDDSFDGTSAIALFKGVPPNNNGVGGELVDVYGEIGGAGGVVNPTTFIAPNFSRSYSARLCAHPSTDFLESQWQFAGHDGLWDTLGVLSLGWMQFQTQPGEYQGCGAGAPGVFCDGASGAACPCGNISTSGGCLNSIFQFSGVGGILTANTYQGSVSADTNDVNRVVLQTSSVPNSTCLYFQGTSRLGNGSGVPFGDGLRCVGGAVLRIGVKTGIGWGSTYGDNLADAPISVRGLIPVQGGIRHYQGWYRNSAAYCVMNATFNLTNAVTVQWAQ